MEPEKRKKIPVFLPWTLFFAVLVAATIYGFVNRQSSSPLQASVRKIELLTTMRIHLLEAIAAEKNAVLAITDEASKKFAEQARQAAEGVEKNRKEVELIIDQDKNPKEMDLINQFNASWLQFNDLEGKILDLATQNTNLKAQQISATQCAHEMELFEGSLNRLIQKNMNRGQCNDVLVHSYKALTAGLKLLALQRLHIEEVEDQAMDTIERSMDSYDKSARKALGTLHRIPDLIGKEDLKNATSAYERFMSLTGEVLRLSRLNTNIKSAELSLGKKRLISSQCQEILATLQDTVQAQRFKATR